MRQLSLLILSLLFGVVAAWAVPANPTPVVVKQPDGGTVTLRLHGDEYLHFMTTTDGYSVVRDAQGYYVYAQKRDDGQLSPTSVIAHDLGARASRELDFLAATPKMMAPEFTEKTLAEKQDEQVRRARTLQARKAAYYDYSKFRGLIILVEFNDCSFMNSDMHDIMDGMVNEENYTGTDKTNYTNWYYGIQAKCTGSVHDYYRDNSHGLFSPKFDIVGPVKVDRSQYYPQTTTNALQLMKDALTAADDLVNYKDYDTDGNGEVDMVYFIFAGAGAHASGDNRLLWPHASILYEDYEWSWGGWVLKPYVKDNVNFGRYACGVELLYTPDMRMLDGIGTICHEFSHVLGLPDFYDTGSNDGSESQSHYPGVWSVMSGGNYGNHSRTPVGYSLYERYALGFTTPEEIEVEGTITLDALNTSNKGYMLKTPVRNEYFMIENRQQTKWDASLPYHGMLVHRVDRTNTTVWDNNTINNNPKHLYYELLFADGFKSLDGSTTDPFPGTANVTTLNNSTTPSLLTWSGRANAWGLENISERGGKITFDVVDANVLKSISLPETFSVGVGTHRKLVVERVPSTAPCTFVWTSSDTNVVTVDQDGLLTGIAEGTATVTVTANGSLSASCSVTVVQHQMAPNLAALRSMAVGTEAMLQLTDAQVLYVSGNTSYVRDASGSMVFGNLGLSLAKGNLINGTVYVRRDEINQLPQVMKAGDMTDISALTVTAGSTPAPRDVHLSELTEADYADFVTLRAVRFEKRALANGSNRVVAFEGDAISLLSNPFSVKNISMPANYEGRYYDVEGIFGTEIVGDQLYNALYLLKASAIKEADLSAISSPTLQVKVQTADGMLSLSGFKAGTEVVVYSITGRRVASGRTNASGSLQMPALSWPAGIYVLRVDGESVKLTKK